MAKVQVQVTGGAIQQKEASTVGELKTLLGVVAYTATVNGEPSSDSDELNDYEFISLAPAVKGARVILRKQGALAYR